MDMRINRELLAFFLYVIFISIGEITVSLINPIYGLIIHSIILLSLLTLASLWYVNPSSNMFLSLSLAPLTRILSLSMPLTYFPKYSWYSVVGATVFAAALMVIRVSGLSLTDIGITMRKPLIQVGVALTGMPFGIMEYYILKPEPLATNLSTIQLILLAATLIFFTGFVEELVFRGIIQPCTIKAIGERAGLIGVTMLFASLHIGWLSIPDIIFVFSIGLFFAICTLKTGSLIGVSLSHGITNVTLFLIMPPHT